MEYFTQKLDNGNIIEYQIVDGTYYHKQTPQDLIKVLEHNRNTHTRIKIYYGDVKTGKAWGDVETGYIGRSTGDVKIPLVVYNSRALGGGALLDHCIVKIEVANKKRAGVGYYYSGVLYDITQ